MVVRYGGQAVFEGVMMRGADRYAIAVRRPDGGIEVAVRPLPTWGRGLKEVPLVRGVVALAEALPLGYRSLLWSAEHGLGQVRRAPRWWERILSVASVAVVIVVASALPAAAGRWAAGAIGIGAAAPMLEMAFGVAMLYGYLRSVGRLGEVVRLFANHGAEHKVVNAFEAGAPLTVESVQRFSTRHPRCGTSFLLVVGVVAAIVFAAAGAMSLGGLIATRVLALPVIAAIAAEVQLRLADSGGGPLSRPGLALQRLTTREPSDAQVEVAIAALQAVLPGRSVPAVPALAHIGQTQNSLPSGSVRTTNASSGSVLSRTRVAPRAMTRSTSASRSAAGQ